MAALHKAAVPIASLLLHNADSGYNGVERSIFPNDQFDVGRRDVYSIWATQEPTISTHHLRFRCVVYDEDDEREVSPMVYVRVMSPNATTLRCRDLGPDDIGHVVSQEDPDVLLNDGDILYLTRSISLTFKADKRFAANNGGLDAIRYAELKHFKDEFSISDRKLGVGGHASVFVAIKQRSKRQVACKILALPLADQERPSELRMTAQDRKAKELRLLKKREELAREYSILKGLKHPNIITLEKVICATYNVYIFQELITGGDLLSYIDQKGALNEAQAVVVVRQLLKAVDYLHDSGVVHRDIKPENVLMTSWRDGARVVLTDFGQARTITGAKAAARNSAVFRMQSVVGTHGYVAPEVLKQARRDLLVSGYSKAIDVWSIGCITALLLTGNVIFANEHDEKFATIPEASDENYTQRWDLSFMDSEKAWTVIGRKARSFVKGCLVLNEGQRLTVKQALLHVWFTNRHYAAEVEAAYERAVEDWKPREQDDDLVEYIDTSDALATASRQQEIANDEGLERSHHFVAPPAISKTLPGPLLRVNMPGAVHRHKHKPTSLPSISEEVGGVCVEVAASPPSPHSVDFFADSACPSIPTQPLSQLPDESMRRLSIEDLAPPETQFTFATPQTQLTFEQRPRLMQRRVYDSVTQSQSMLDELSPVKLTQATAPSGSEQLCAVPPTADDASVRPRKKVCR